MCLCYIDLLEYDIEELIYIVKLLSVLVMY